MATTRLTPSALPGAVVETELLQKSVSDTATATETLSITVSLSVNDTAVGSEALGRSIDDLTFSIEDAGHVTEFIHAPIIFISDTGGLAAETIVAPIFVITDTATATETISRPLLDAATATETIAITVSLAVSDSARGSDALSIDGPAVIAPDDAATGELDNTPVLRLLYGNDKRNPVRTLDLAQSAPGNIYLVSGGFAPGTGELNELWSDPSIRHHGRKKFGESRDNSQLAVKYDLASTSMAALGYFQRKISRFFAEIKQYQVLHGQGQKVWLEYRWADNLNSLPTPTFGQLSSYYELLSVKAPKWPDDLDTGNIVAGNILDIALALTASPSPKGLKQLAARASGDISLVAEGVRVENTTDSKLHYTDYPASGLDAKFTVTGWITAYWETTPTDDRWIFEYYYDDNNRIRFAYQGGNTRWRIIKIITGTTYASNSASHTVATGEHVHICIVQDGTTFRLYINGVEAASVTAPNTMIDGGTIALGGKITGAITGADVALDGWRILPEKITSTQVEAIYNAELPIKQDGGQVGPPLYFWTKDGDSQLDGANDTDRDNWGLIGGVGGDIEAELEVHLNSATALNQFWLGVKSQPESYLPLSYLWFESSNEIADATASGGGYESENTTAIFTKTKATLEPSLLFNQYRLLARLNGSLALSITPAYAFSSIGTFFASKITGYTGVSSFQLVDLGDVFVKTDASVAEETTVNFITKLTITGASSTVSLDYLFYLPAPYAKITGATSDLIADHTLVIEGGQAYTKTTGPSIFCDHIGPALTVLPNQYNYLFLLMGFDGAFTPATTADLVVYVTPHYLLPGGMVA